MNSDEARQIVERETAHFLSRCSLMYTEKQAELITRALNYSVTMHDGQFRASGEPYIVHPIAVANLLLDIGLDHSTIAAALLDRKSVV